MGVRRRIPPSAAAAATVLLALAAFSGSGPARADELRYVPQDGAMLTYRTLVHTQMNAASASGASAAARTAGFVYTVVITASDDLVARGVVRESELLFGANDCTGECVQFRKAVGARIDGGLLVVPIPDAVSDAYAAFSAVQYRLFLTDRRRFPVPAPAAEPQAGAESQVFGTVPASIVTTEFECDKAALQSFLPFGKTPRVQVECLQSVESLRLLPALQWPPPPTAQAAVSMGLAYEGRSRVTTPAGEWPVQNIHITLSLPEGGREERDLLFSDTIGATIRVHSVLQLPQQRGTVTTDAELIRYDEQK